MRQTHVCERCGTPFVRDRITQRGCSPRCRRWLYEHQDLLAGNVAIRGRLSNPNVVETQDQKDARLREQRRNVMRRYRAKSRAKTISERISDPAKRAAYVAVATKEAKETAQAVTQRTCDICHNTFIHDPSSGLLPGCSKLCRRLLYRRQIMRP